MVSECELEGDELAADIASRGVAFAQLLDFVFKQKLNSPERKDWTTAQVVRDVILPLTRRLRCSYADVAPGVDIQIAKQEVGVAAATALSSKRGVGTGEDDSSDSEEEAVPQGSTQAEAVEPPEDGDAAIVAKDKQYVWEIELDTGWAPFAPVVEFTGQAGERLSYRERINNYAISFEEDGVGTQTNLATRKKWAIRRFEVGVGDNSGGKVYIHAGRWQPQTLISHWWGNRFLDLCRSIAVYVGGTDSLQLSEFTERQLRHGIWLCIFAVNQHVSICRTEYNPCFCKGPQFKEGPRCEMDKFPQVMRHIERHALAMDAELRTFQRVWVLSEIGEALRTNKATTFVGYPSTKLMDAAINGESVVPRVEDAEATFEEDKIKILDAISGSVGFGRFNEDVQTKVVHQLFLGRAFSEVNEVGRGKAGKLASKLARQTNGHAVLSPKLLSLLLQDPSLARKRNPMDGFKTLLSYCLIWPNPAIDAEVRLLLALGADPNQEIGDDGSTLMHRAAAFVVRRLCYTLEDEEDAMEKAEVPRFLADLLALGGDVHRCDGAGRAPVDCAVLRSTTKTLQKMKRRFLQAVQLRGAGQSFLRRAAAEVKGAAEEDREALRRAFRESPEVQALVEKAEPKVPCPSASQR